MKNTLAEQLDALKLKLESAAAPVVPSASENVRPKLKLPHPSNQDLTLAAGGELQNLLCQLPMLGLIQSVDVKRRIGFLTSPRLSHRVFFHFDRQQPCRSADLGSLQVEKPILFIEGSDQNIPARHAVRWALVQDLNWNGKSPPRGQAGLDALRRSALTQIPLARFWQLLHADWYCRQRGAFTPSDLDDPVLEAVWFDRIAALTPDQLVSEGVRQHWQQCRFRFLDRPNVNRLLDALTNHQLAAIAPPMQAWMNVATTVTNKQRLMEWHLLCNDGVIAPDWSRWFQGRDSFEAAAAGFLIDRGLRGDERTKHWIQSLIGNGLLDQAHLVQWVGDRDVEAVPVFEHLPEQRQREFWTAWNASPPRLQAALDATPSAAAMLLRSTSLAIDLETDGEAIWEIGCASASQKELLYAHSQGGNLGSAMELMAQRMQTAPLLAGHNLLAWDWPVLSQHINVAPSPQLWDTLLVQYLIAPQARSHALGSNHQADDDALAAFKLFDAQIEGLEPSFFRQLLEGRFESPVQLLGGVAHAMADSTSYARAAPNWLGSCDCAGATLVLPEHRLRDLDWVQGVTVVCANPQENLPIQWLQIDVDRLAAALPVAAVNDAPTEVLLAVLKRARQQGIAVRFGMIPPWLLESSAVLHAAVRQACFEPTLGNVQGRCVAPMPCDVVPLLAAGPAAYRFLDSAEKVLFFDQQPMVSIAFQGLVKACTASPLVRVERRGDVQVWLQADRPARLLEQAAGWRSFRTVPLPEPMVLAEPPRVMIQYKPPLLATRRTLVLYPNAMDQEGYWLEVIRTFYEVAADEPTAVPILLMVSSGCGKLLDLLNIGLAEIGWGEVRPPHRSRLEHLRRAAHRGFALVDRVERWPEWQALAATAEVSLLPVIEALPLEQWFAAAQTLLPEDAESEGADGDTDDVGGAEVDVAARDDSNDDVDDEHGIEETEVARQEVARPAVPSNAATEVRSVGMAALLEQLTELVVNNLQRWLISTGLGQSEHAVRLLDSRAATLGQGLRDVVDLFPIHGEPIAADYTERLKQTFEAMQIPRESAPSDYASMEQFLIENWQPSAKPGQLGGSVKGFKPSQKPAMEAICTRANDVLVALPTGEGKSVLFQVPALCRGLRTRRLTLVLSPLKALMRDQVERLREQGFSESADYLSSDRPAHEITEVLQGVLDHRVVLLYVAPERLRSELFVTVLRQRVDSDGGLEYAVVDETHCVNQWGHEFRPDYFHAMDMLLREFRTGGENGAETSPILLLSATVTASDRKQLQDLVQGLPRPVPPRLPFVNKPDGFAQPLGAHIQVQSVRVQGRINDRQAFDQVLEGRLSAIKAAIEQAKTNHSQTKQRSAVIIFVNRREHAEKLAHRLAIFCGSEVDYFHAGLPSATREEVRQCFLDGKINVLVATKAFGMGMDIPDIHWAIHLGPPAYLEDYLQEVGRIGRDDNARKNARLDRVQASLLFSADDFESVRSLRARSALHLATIKQFYQTICANAQQIDGQWMALVPQDGFDPPSHPAARRMHATQLRLALYWLDRAGRLRLSGLVPRLLSVTLNSAQLERIAGQGGKLGSVARVILGVETLPRDTAGAAPDGGVARTAGNWLGRALSRLGDMVGFLLGLSTPVGGVPTSVSTAASSTGTAPAVGSAVINLSQIMLRCSIKSIGEVMACLVDLEKRGGLELKRNFQFAPRALALEPMSQIGRLFDEVGRASQELIRRLGEQNRLRFDISELVQGFVASAVDPAQSSQYQAAFDWGVASLARTSGVRMRQVVEQDQTVRWEAQLASSVQYQVQARCNTTLDIAREVFKVLQPKAIGNDTLVSLKELVDATRNRSPGQKFRESELKKALNLLSALRLVSLSAELLPMSYVLTLDSLNEALEVHQGLWDELEDVNRMAELRNNAMEIFANLPAEAQGGFIEGYFAQTDAAGLEAFLITQLGNIDDRADTILNKFISEKLEQLRATEAIKFFERYKASEEPNQWQAICHPYDQHLLVNAGPGAGKTAVLVGRVVHLIREQGIQPSDIIVLAFNRAVVFEIRKRVRELFRTLGYAAYVKPLRISTFHAFAMRSLADSGQAPSPDREELLPDFAERLARNPQFRRQVAGNCRTILVDEFQDMTDDIYQILHQVHLGSGAGVMVIGDDDQDILRWQRRDGSFSEKYFKQFVNDFGGEGLLKLSLQVNFRSGVEIVNKSQTMISEIFKRNQHSHRLKNFQLRSRHEPLKSEVERIDWRDWDTSQAMEYVRQMCEQRDHNNPGSLAVLCRSNGEVAQAYSVLAVVVPDLVAHGAVNYLVADLRHVGLWVEYLDAEIKRQNRVLTDDLKRELIEQFIAQAAIPEMQQPQDSDVRLEDLWDLCTVEQSFAHLSDLVRFIRDMQLDELGRLLGGRDGRPQAIVSTIHKVKGLEFDRVIVLPSSESFPLQRSKSQNVPMDAAEEARLLYVAMTRAKKNLTYFVGVRELSWYQAEEVEREQVTGKLLFGSHKEVALGWSMGASNFNQNPDACQAYIERHVRIGDSVRLGGWGAGGGMSLIHQTDRRGAFQVGFLSRSSGAGGAESSLKVSAVVRFRPDRDEDGTYPANLAPSIQQKGWGYVVLVSGRLR